MTSIFKNVMLTKNCAIKSHFICNLTNTVLMHCLLVAATKPGFLRLVSDNSRHTAYCNISNRSDFLPYPNKL